MSDDDFQVLTGLLRRESGLVVGRDKTYLLESRLVPVARRFGLAGVAGIAGALRGRPDPALVGAVVEAMTTNESFFFRDGRPFERLGQAILGPLIDRRADERRLRIWCAACSTGQEPYSVAMCLADHAARLGGWRPEIVATDISEEALARAREGAYSQFEVQRGLPVQRLVKHFVQDGTRWLVKPELKANISFRRFNLLDDPRALGRFDIVFCRNVLIYFDLATKRRVLEGIGRQLAPDGYLFLGGAETVVGVTERFVVAPDERGIYQPAAAPQPVPQPVPQPAAQPALPRLSST
jgi:chemotaxis protein methyltransferase CheR